MLGGYSPDEIVTSTAMSSWQRTVTRDLPLRSSSRKVMGEGETVKGGSAWSRARIGSWFKSLLRWVP